VPGGGFRYITTTEEDDIRVADQRGVTRETRQRCVAPPHRHTQTHARHRTRSRFLGCCEVGVGIHVGQTDRARGHASYTDKASEDDTAVATEQQGEATVFGGCGDSFTERQAIGSDFTLVPGTTWWPNVISICSRKDIAQIYRTEAFDQTQRPEDFRRTIHVSRLTAVIRTNTDSGRRSNDRNRAVHITSV
jgi:hypothetical protein